MVDPVLIAVLGDAVNLRVLNFFIENPFDKFTVSEIAKFSSVSRNSVYKYLEDYIQNEYLLEMNGGRRVYYRLNRSNRIVQLIDRFVENVGDILITPDARRDILETRICVEVWLIDPVEGIEIDSKDVEQMFKKKYDINAAVVKFKVR